jgi:hypothetical protein
MVLATTVLPSEATTVQYATKLVPQYGAGAWEGKLTLTTQPDGTISGTYRTADGDFVPVTGGRDGDRVWLDIGLRGRLTIVGTVDASGAIRGTTREAQEVDPNGLEWQQFTATVAAS